MHIVGKIDKEIYRCITDDIVTEDVIITTEDNIEYKNSIITFMKIDNREWQRLIRNKKVLYTKE